MGEENSFENGVPRARAWSLSWQAASGRDFLANPALVARTRERLINAHRQPGRVLVSFVLMPQEIHAISKIDDGASIGGIARSISHILSRWVREAQSLRGPVFAGPCHAERLESEEALRREVRMLAWRPVSQKLCVTPMHYPHSAFRIALGMKPADDFDARALLRLFGDSVNASRSALRIFVRARPTEEQWRVWELTRGLQMAAGSEGMLSANAVARVMDAPAAMLIAAGGGYGIDGALRLLEAWVSAKIHPAFPLDLHLGSSVETARGRALVAGLAVNYRLCSAAAVARHFHRAKATLSEQMNASRARAADRLILATPVRRVLQEAAFLKIRPNDR